MSGLSKDPEKRAKQLANLRPVRTAEQARINQAKGVETKRKRKEALEALQISAKDLEEVGSLNIMRGLVQIHLDNLDYEGAAKLLSQIAEYEQPKLQRQEINQTTKVKELTNEELQAELDKLKI